MIFYASDQMAITLITECSSSRAISRLLDATEVRPEGSADGSAGD